MKHRIGVLDSFRGLAALAVVYYHYTTWFRFMYGHTFSDTLDFTYGPYCVSFFFIISGFVIFMTVERCKSPIEFAYRRFIRIYPSYWICLIITSLVLHFYGVPTSKPTLNQFAANFTMIQKVFSVKPIDGSYWSLFPELLFYGVIFFVFVTRLLERVYLWGGIWLALSFVNGYFHLQRADQFFQYSGLFLSGIVFYKMFKGDKSLKHHLSLLVCYITVVVGYNSAIAGVSSYIPIGVVYIIFYLFLYHKLDFLDIKPLGFLGYISYPLYLIHQELGFTILLHLKSDFGFTGYWTIFVPIVISLLLAYVVARFIEKPILKLAKTHIDTRFFIKDKQAVA